MSPPRPSRWAAASSSAGVQALLGSALALMVGGYAYGTSDQSVQLSVVRALAWPGAERGDLVFTAAGDHASAWFPALALVARSLGWEAMPWVSLGAWGGALVATMWAVVALSRLVSGRPGVGWSAVLLAGFAHPLPGHVRTIEPEWITRVGVLPGLLWAFAAVLSGRFMLAGLLAGLAVNLHASTAVHACLAVVAASLADPQRRRTAPRALIGVVLGGGPFVLWMLSRGGPPSMSPEWLDVLELRLGHHLFARGGPVGTWVLALVWLSLLAAGVRLAPSGSVRRRLAGLGAGALFCAAAGAFTPPVAVLLQLHLSYAWVLVAFLGIASAPLILARGRWAHALLVGVVLLPEHALADRDRPRVFQVTDPLPAAEGRALVAAATAVCSDCPVLIAPWEEPWVRASTGLPLVVTVKDGGESIFGPAFAAAWRSRLSTACGGDPLRGMEGAEWRGHRAIKAAARESFSAASGPELVARGTALGAMVLLDRAGAAHDDLVLLWRGREWGLWRLQ